MTELIQTEEVKGCKFCGVKDFNPYVSEGEKEFFAQNNLSEPKMCPECRRIQKIMKAIMRSDKEYQNKQNA